MRTKTTLLTLIALAACATAMPPKDLVDARAAYTRAEQSPAKTYKPDELHEARVDLDQAEKSFSSNGANDDTVMLAYVAERRAQLAEADGSTAEAYDKKQQATSQLTQTATADLQRTRSELSQTQQQLVAETQARQDSERRAKDALDKLALASVPVKQDVRGTVITLPGSVLFASGKFALLSSGEQKLAQVASALKDQPDQQIAIEGYTDSRGSDETNQTLSEHRAQSVKNYLVAQGLAGDHISAVGLGPSKPVADNSTAEGRADNRRVEIVVKPPPEPR